MMNAGLSMQITEKSSDNALKARVVVKVSYLAVCCPETLCWSFVRL